MEPAGGDPGNRALPRISHWPLEKHRAVTRSGPLHGSTVHCLKQGTLMQTKGSEMTGDLDLNGRRSGTDESKN